MMTTGKWIEIAYITFAPLAVLFVNATDFVARGKNRRGRLLCLEQRGPKNYLTVHGLLLLGMALLIASFLWKPASAAFHVTMATWFMWVNIHAMISRRRKTNNRLEPISKS